MRRIGFIGLGVLLLALAAIVLFSRSAPMPQYQGRGADYWLDRIFGRQSAVTQPQAIEAFRNMGTDAIPFLVRTLEQPDTGAAKIHAALYEHCPSVLRKWLAKPNYGTRQSAAQLVLLNSSFISFAVPQLIDLVKRSSGQTHYFALTLLFNRLQPDYAEYASAFIPCLGETNASVRYMAVQLLTDIDNRSNNVVAEVSKLLKDPDDTVRISAAYAVWKLSGDTNATVPVLKEELSKTNLSTFSPYYQHAMPDYRVLIIHHLFNIDPRSSVVADYFRTQLKSSDAKDRRQACEELQRLGRHVRFLLPDISPLYDDPDVEVMKAARELLRKLDPIRFNTAPL